MSLGGSSGAPSFTSQSAQTAPLSLPAPEPPRASRLQRFDRHLGLSRGVANQLSLCGRQSSRCLYQYRWECYRAWCASRGHSVSSPTVSKIADFLLFLRAEKHLSISAIKGYCSTFTSVFKYHLPELLDSFILRDLICSFEIELPCRPVDPPLWDLVKVLEYLPGSIFELLSSKPLQVVTMKVPYLLALAMAKRVGEFQALSSRVAFRGPDLSLAYWRSWPKRNRSAIPFLTLFWLNYLRYLLAVFQRNAYCVLFVL